MKTSELAGAALDLAVAKCEVGIDRVWFNYETHGTALRGAWMCGNFRHSEYEPVPRYSTNWAQGGPIIEREKIGLEQPSKPIVYWNAVSSDGTRFMGMTPLIAAMRCYVASKLGDEVEIPEELTK